MNERSERFFWYTYWILFQKCKFSKKFHKIPIIYKSIWIIIYIRIYNNVWFRLKYIIKFDLWKSYIKKIENNFTTNQTIDSLSKMMIIFLVIFLPGFLLATRFKLHYIFDWTQFLVFRCFIIWYFLKPYNTLTKQNYKIFL